MHNFADLTTAGEHVELPFTVKQDPLYQMYVREGLPAAWRDDLYGVSCELGSGTEWCTATGKTRRHFDKYISKGPLFIFIKPGSDEKYQFSYETNSFMDKNDSSIM